eukprot:m.130730 g.130730  ORF g.130730 m.130730 type:complete len:176 (-) comp15728_c0_seq4:253-780(-)
MEDTFGFEEQEAQQENEPVENISGFDGFDSDEEDFKEQDEPDAEVEPVTDDRIFKVGWMKKKGGGKLQRGRHRGSLFARTNWKTRWFVLRDTMLKYYPFQTINGKEKAIGWVNIKPDVVVQTDDTDPASFSLTTDERVFHFIAESKDQAHEWVDLLKKSILRAQLQAVQQNYAQP